MRPVDPGPTDDGSLWARPARSRRSGVWRMLLIVAGVTLVLVVVVLQLMSYAYPRTTTYHGKSGIAIRSQTIAMATLA